MNLSISMQSPGGHTEVNFEEGRVKLTWKETTLRERGMLRAMIEKAKAGGAKAFSVDKHGNADKETDVVPGVIFDRSGELILKGDGPLVRLLAQGLIETEQKNGRMVMEAQDDDTWRILHSNSEVKLDSKPVDETKPVSEENPEKKKKIHTTAKEGGG